MNFGIDDHPVFVIDQSRCIGCQACVQACAECGTHRGQSLIHLDRIDRATSTLPLRVAVGRRSHTPRV
ncbi:MAG: 4Fe-4S binding protein, partial [Ilumatobacteraceae bacterium]